MANCKSDILVLIDGSYFLYYVIFGAVNKYIENYKLEASTMIKPAEETDQENLPDLLVSDAFKKELKTSTIKRCEMIDFLLKKNFQNEIDTCNNIDILFVMDDRLVNSFRKEIYPEYKAQRKLAKKSYKVYNLKDYVVDVLFNELNICQEYGYKIIKVTGAEGDDVIACSLMNFNDYMCRILFASDHDFLQLENVNQFDLRGNKVEQKLTFKGEQIVLTPNQVLFMKLILGDGSDGIPGIGYKIGPVKAYKFYNDKEKFKTFLKEHQDAAKQFMLNKKLISFKEMPTELSASIINDVSEKIKSEKTSIEKIDDNIRNLMSL